MSDPVLIAIITGVFLLLTAAVNSRVNRNSARQKGLEAAVLELAEQNASQAAELARLKTHNHDQDLALKSLEDTNEQQKEEMATLREQVAEFQIYVDQVDEVFSTASDEATVGSIRPKLPLKPDKFRPAHSKIKPAPAKEGD